MAAVGGGGGGGLRRRSVRRLRTWLFGHWLLLRLFFSSLFSLSLSTLFFFRLQRKEERSETDSEAEREEGTELRLIVVGGQV